MAAPVQDVCLCSGAGGGPDHAAGLRLATARQHAACERCRDDRSARLDVDGLTTELATKRG